MGLFGFISSIFGGNSEKEASQKAMEAQVAAYNRGIDIQNQQYQQTRTDFMPYTTAGTQAIGGLSNLVGLNGADKTQASIMALKDSPIYQSLFNNGQEALLANASATGGLRGGDTQRASLDFGSDVLAKVYADQVNNLGGLAGLGVGATGSVANFGAGAANATTALNSSIGDAQARNYITRGGITANQWASGGQFLDQAASAIAGGFGGGVGDSSSWYNPGGSQPSSSFLQSLKSIF